MKADIRTIEAHSTWPVRQHVFGPDQPLSQAMLEQDDSGRHFGVFVDDHLVTVGSLFLEQDGSLRLRKLATLPDYQNLGLGGALLEYFIDLARQEGRRLWCAVRTPALPFYEGFGFRPEGPAYAKGNHQHQVISLAPLAAMESPLAPEPRTPVSAD